VNTPVATRLEFERRLLACPTLPSLPAVALQILQLCRDEEVDLWQIAEAIASDPALASRILRAANSASVAARGKVSTLTRAVALLGSKAVMAISLSFGLLRNRRTDRASGFDRTTFWRRAVFSAIAARATAEITSPIVDPEEAFVAGLLQDLGMLALAEVFQHEYGSLCVRAAGNHDALAALERAAWGADHADASALLARTWLLPVSLQLAIGASHEALTAEAVTSEARLVRCVAISGRIADVWVAPHGDETQRAAEAARQTKGLSPAAFEGILARMALAVPETATDFEIDLGGPTRVDEVLLEAQALLRLRVPPGTASVPPAPKPVLLREEDLAGLRIAFEYARARAAPITLLLVARSEAAAAASAPLGEILQGCLRSIDLLRELPDGVLALLPDTDLAGGRAAAELVLEQLARAGQRAYAGVAAEVPGPEATLERLCAAVSQAAARSRSTGGTAATVPGGRPGGSGEPAA